MKKLFEGETIRLSSGQSVLLFACVIVIAVLSFILGNLTGKDEQAVVQKDKVETSVENRVTSKAGETGPSMLVEEGEAAKDLIKESELTFYKSLTATEKVKKKRKTPVAEKEEKRKAIPEGDEEKSPPEPVRAERGPEGEALAGSYSIQVGATPKVGAARALKEKLLSKGFDAYLVEFLKGETTWYRIRVGNLDKREEALQLAERIKKEEGVAGFVTKNSP